MDAMGAFWLVGHAAVSNMPVAQEHCGQSASFSANCSTPLRLKDRAFTYCDGIWKCAAAESPRMATPMGAYGPEQNASSNDGMLALPP